MFNPDPDLDFLPVPDPGVNKVPDPGSGSATLMDDVHFSVVNQDSEPDGPDPHHFAVSGSESLPRTWILYIFSPEHFNMLSKILFMTTFATDGKEKSL